MSDLQMDVSKMDSREILNSCFGIPTEEMRGDCINDLFSSLRDNGSKHVVDGLLLLFERYAEQQSRMEGEVLNQSSKVFDCMRLRFVNKFQEEFYALILDNKYRMIDEPLLITRGTLNQSLVHPRECFKESIKRSAAAIIFIHNHPSGDPHPSTQDIDITKRLREVGQVVGINVLDHIIIGTDSFYSFADEEII